MSLFSKRTVCMAKIFSYLFLSIVVLGCSKDDSIHVDLSKFDTITERFPYTDLNPEVTFNYYELLYSIEGNADEELITSEGTLCANASDADACAESFNAIETMFGFAGGCLPSYCFLYIKLQEEGTNAILNTPEQLLTFLGTIDSASEAILWANVNGYSHSSSSKETGAIRKVDDHFELLVSELVSGCLPYQTDQVHLRIDSDGKITELGRAVYSYAKNSCI